LSDEGYLARVAGGIVVASRIPENVYTTDALIGQFLKRKERLAACNIIYCIGIS
jgi:hypothetical protein